MLRGFIHSRYESYNPTSDDSLWSVNYINYFLGKHVGLGPDGINDSLQSGWVQSRMGV
ncbi:protein of unknown function [Kyrpidia spormannii]|uniref:Uncharacterized protein n=2 Tax=Kyrpidia spormannii TaxID=2055160 RepID=A0ACA8ZBC7_9BACL|nr:protein of unknown function [Kyrpidia spormannii]CAB3394539.1 protein of unknown function [Kyrpidia spormannii]